MLVRQVWLWQINFNGRAVGTFSKTNTPAVSCLWTTWTVWMFLVLFIIFLTIILLWFVSEIGGTLLLCFPLQQITSYKFMALLATCDLNFPLCPSGSKHLTHLACCFTWFKVLIPRIWIFTSNIFLPQFFFCFPPAGNSYSLAQSPGPSPFVLLFLALLASQAVPLLLAIFPVAKPTSQLFKKWEQTIGLALHH